MTLHCKTASASAVFKLTPPSEWVDELTYGIAAFSSNAMYRPYGLRIHCWRPVCYGSSLDEVSSQAWAVLRLFVVIYYRERRIFIHLYCIVGLSVGLRFHITFLHLCTSFGTWKVKTFLQGHKGLFTVGLHHCRVPSFSEVSSLSYCIRLLL